MKVMNRYMIRGGVHIKEDWMSSGFNLVLTFNHFMTRDIYGLLLYIKIDIIMSLSAPIIILIVFLIIGIIMYYSISSNSSNTSAGPSTSIPSSGPSTLIPSSSNNISIPSSNKRAIPSSGPSTLIPSSSNNISIPSSNKRGLYFILPDNTLIFNPRNRNTSKPITTLYIETKNKYKEIYEEMYNNLDASYLFHCDDTTSVDSDKFCVYDPTPLEALYNNGFYLNTMEPIILLSFRNLPEFIPEVYENISDLPMSDDHEVVALRTHMQTIYDRDNKLPQCVWVSCTHIYPGRPLSDFQGFPKYYFPSKEHIENYLPPVLPLQIKLNVGPNDISCKMWAKNIDNTKDFFANVSFNIWVPD